MGHELEDKLAGVFWRGLMPGGNWEARLSYYRATDEQKQDAYARQVDPSVFTDNWDVEGAFNVARKAVETVAEFFDQRPCESREQGVFLSSISDEILGVARPTPQKQEAT